MLSSNIVKILHIAALLTLSAAISTFAFGQSAPAATDASHVVLNTMAQELQRNFDSLKTKADPPPYFLSYEITDQDSHAVSASLGVLNATEAGRNRYLDVTVRVGDPKLDNFRRVRGENYELLKELPDAVYQRTGNHSERGPITLRFQLELLAEHAESHARQMQAIREEYKKAKGKK